VLRDRLTSPIERVAPTEQERQPLWILAKSLLSIVNLDKLPRPDPTAARSVATAASALVLAAATWLALKNQHRRGGVYSTDTRVFGFGVIWCIASWLPIFQGTIGWHPYYGSLGVFGAWLVLGVPLARWPRAATTVLFVLGLLRGAAAATPSWDWGGEWYQTRAGNMLHVIRAQLLAMHPTLPAHTRLYFGNIPNNIGLIAGRSPAVRVWYGDPTLEGGFYSYYRARPLGAPRAPDLFFTFDSTSGIHEVFADGRANPATGQRDARWEDDAGKLAMTFVTNGDLLRAAELFDVIGQLPHRTDAAMFAAVCREVAGASGSAERGYVTVQARTGGTRKQVMDWAARLRASMPRRSERAP
jgi:hypothetical protein